jgi:hypothetical protein
MQCLLCGAEMRLEEVAEIKTVPVSGFKRYTFKCLVCGDVEQRLLHGDVKPISVEAAPLCAEMVGSRTDHPERPAPSGAPIVLPLAATEHPDAAASGLAKHVFSKLTRLSRVVVRRLGRGVEVRSAIPDIVTPATPVPSSEPLSGPEEYEDLLRRLLRVTRPSSQDSIIGPGLQPATQGSLPAVESVALPITSALPELGSAVAVIDATHSEAGRGATALSLSLPASVPEAEPPFPTAASKPSASGAATAALASSHSDLEQTAPAAASSPPNAGAAAPSLAANQEPTAPATSLAKAEPEIPTEVARSPQTESSASRRIVVHIQYDAAKSKYVALDMDTGFPILRHYDGIRLREMCDRMNLQVVHDEASSKGYWSEASRKSQASGQMKKTT